MQACWWLMASRDQVRGGVMLQCLYARIPATPWFQLFMGQGASIDNLWSESNEK